MTPRYHVIGADCAGQFYEQPEPNLRAAVIRRAELQRHYGTRGRTFLICDSERDGATLSDEEIEALCAEEKL